MEERILVCSKVFTLAALSIVLLPLRRRWFSDIAFFVLLTDRTTPISTWLNTLKKSSCGARLRRRFSIRIATPGDVGSRLLCIASRRSTHIRAIAPQTM